MKWEQDWQRGIYILNIEGVELTCHPLGSVMYIEGEDLKEKSIKASYKGGRAVLIPNQHSTVDEDLDTLLDYRAYFEETEGLPERTRGLAKLIFSSLEDRDFEVNNAPPFVSEQGLSWKE